MHSTPAVVDSSGGLNGYATREARNVPRCTQSLHERKPPDEYEAVLNLACANFPAIGSKFELSSEAKGNVSSTVLAELKLR